MMPATRTNWCTRLLIVAGVCSALAIVSVGGLVALSWYDIHKWTGGHSTNVKLIALQPSFTRGFWVKYRMEYSHGGHDDLYWCVRPWRGVFLSNYP